MSSGTPREKAELIQYIGVSALSPEEQDTVNTIATEHYEKIKRGVHNDTSLVVHVKTHNAEGNRKKYSMHVRVITPTKQQFDSSNADDWELPRALHKAFEDVQNQIRHKLHTDTTRPR
ncbi:hypothetical protein C4580_05495 [Candidatus Woesearchaeota archaeon]|nr:MAG: hypothetical protein C4580_05495 [Candidatus Woesearchaeota archaeon]